MYLICVFNAAFCSFSYLPGFFSFVVIKDFRRENFIECCNILPIPFSYNVILHFVFAANLQLLESFGMNKTLLQNHNCVLVCDFGLYGSRAVRSKITDRHRLLFVNGNK